jgi:hypothetical protein
MSLEAGGGWTEPTDEEIEDHLVKEARRLLVQGEALHTREEADYHKDGPTAWREIRRGPDTLATLPFEARREADLMAMAPALAASSHGTGVFTPTVLAADPLGRALAGGGRAAAPDLPAEDTTTQRRRAAQAAAMRIAAIMAIGVARPLPAISNAVP